MRTGRIIIAFLTFIFLVLGGIFIVSRPHNITAFMGSVDFFSMYQNLANPYIRYVNIPAGLRKEEVADIYTKVLAWNDHDREDFLSQTDGYYFPSTYVFAIDASGEEVKDKMVANFNNMVLAAPTMKTSVLNKEKVSIDTALKVASLIQREAAGKHDMNLISGIIWNRIWSGMSLDIDATLQYAKGTEKTWWPQVLSADKNIVSPYNTYKTVGLPPTAISNPSLAAIEAAYNPEKTACIFYFHDKNRKIHCSKTYEEHKKGIEMYLK